MKLTAKSRYAARILLDLAMQAPDIPTSTAEISKSTDVSPQFIEQIMRPLKKAGLIKSIRGVSGGHLLNRPPAKISLGDIIRAVSGPINIASCLENDDECNRIDSCLTRSAWKRASQAIEKELDSITLQELTTSPKATIIAPME